MRKHLALLALAALTHASAWAATYTFTTYPYDPVWVHAHLNCTAGSCANFTPAMAQTGTFTTAVPLDPNLNNINVTADVTSWSFSDGLTTYASNDPLSLLKLLVISTDGAGALTVLHGNALRWQQAAPHADHIARVDMLSLYNTSTHNTVCNIVVPHAAPLTDDCSAAGSDDATSWADVGLVPAGPGVQAVPVDNPFALALAAAGMLGLALRGRRKAPFK